MAIFGIWILSRLYQYFICKVSQRLAASLIPLAQVNSWDIIGHQMCDQHCGVNICHIRMNHYLNSFFRSSSPLRNDLLAFVFPLLQHGSLQNTSHSVLFLKMPFALCLQRKTWALRETTAPSYGPHRPLTALLFTLHKL